MQVHSVLILIATALLLGASPPLLSARRTKQLLATDFALLLIPTPIFVVALLTFNAAAQTGLALFAYPFIVLAVSVLSLYIRVYLLPASRTASLTLLIGLAVFAALFGALASPLYE